MKRMSALDISKYIAEILDRISENNSEAALLYARKALEELVSNLEKYGEDELDFREIVEYLEDNVFITDGQGKVLYVNPAYEAHTGIRWEQVVGRYVRDILDEGKLFKGGVTLDVIKEKKKVTKLSAVVQDGKEQLGYAVGVPVLDKNGKIIRIVISSRTLFSFTDLQEDFEQFVQAVKNTQFKPGVQIYKSVSQDQLKTMVGSSEEIIKLHKMIDRIAATDATVLVTGESGVGKELIANEIFMKSERSNCPFIKVNCASIPATLLESELFGYEKGAFSGANVNGKPGIFELANNGTLLLDEIGEMPLELQSKLLRAIQSKEVTRLSGTKAIKLNIRFIAMTNCDLKAKVREGTFRQDLYYRINVIPIHIPPLRERVEDIPILCEHFLNIYSRKHKRTVTLPEDVLKFMQVYNWPGNIRELENVIEYLIICYSGEDSEVNTDILSNILNMREETLPPKFKNLNEALADYEKDLLQRVLDISNTLKEAGEILGVDASTISRKIRQYGLKYGNVK